MGYVEARTEPGKRMKRPWRRDDAPSRTYDWAAAIAAKFGQTRARISIEDAPPDSPLAQYAGMDPSEAFAKARAEIIAAQLERQRSN